MEIVAPIGIKIHRLKPVDKRIDVGVSDLRTCTPEQVVELGELCGEVPDEAELLEYESRLNYVNNLYQL